MDIKALRKNIARISRTTSGFFPSLRKLSWLYNLSGRLSSGKSPKEHLLNFKYPTPVGRIKLRVRENGGSDAFIISEVFDQECYHIVPDGEVKHILDLGSNAGFSVVYFSRAFPGASLACVEPMTDNIRLLKTNLALNNITATVFYAAAAASDGRLEMATSEKDYGHKVNDIVFGKEIAGVTVEVEALSVQTMLDRLRWQEIDLLKIDIEGYEGILLTQNNHWLQKVKLMIIEIHEHVSVDEIISIMAENSLIHYKAQQSTWIFSRSPIQ